MNYGRRTILPGLISVIRRVTKCRIFVWIFFSDDHNLEMAKLQGFIICCDMSSIVQHCKSYCHHKYPAVIRIIVIDWCGVHWMSCKRGKKEDAGQLKDMTTMTCQQSDHRHHIFTILMIVRGCWSAARCDADMSQVSSYPEPPGSRMFILLLHLRCLGWALLCHLCVKLPLLSNAFIRLKSPKLYRIENLAQNSTGYKYKWEEPTQLSWTGVCSGELQIWLSHVVLQIVNHMSLGCQHQRSPSHLNTQST